MAETTEREPRVPLTLNVLESSLPKLEALAARIGTDVQGMADRAFNLITIAVAAIDDGYVLGACADPERLDYMILGVVMPASGMLYAIADRPTDYPDNCVVRQWRRFDHCGRTILCAEKQPYAVVNTLEEARSALPAGLSRHDPEPGVAPCIVEYWQ